MGHRKNIGNNDLFGDFTEVLQKYEHEVSIKPGSKGVSIVLLLAEEKLINIYTFVQSQIQFMEVMIYFQLWQEVLVNHCQIFVWLSKYGIEHYYRTIPISDRLLFLSIPVCVHKCFRKDYGKLTWLRVICFRWCSV